MLVEESKRNTTNQGLFWTIVIAGIELPCNNFVTTYLLAGTLKETRWIMAKESGIINTSLYKYRKVLDLVNKKSIAYTTISYNSSLVGANVSLTNLEIF